MWSFKTKVEAYTSVDEFVARNMGKRFVVGFYETNDKGGGAFVDRKRITGRIYDPASLRSPEWIFCVEEDNGRASSRIKQTRMRVMLKVEEMKALLREQGMLVEQDIVCTSRVQINSVAA